MIPIEEAIKIAASAHKGQTDKAGKPYIFHPMRVMLSLNSYEEQVVGILHDVVEDTDLNLDDISNAGFSEEIVKAVDAITKRDGENLEIYIERVKNNPIAKNVKIADINDNISPSRQEYLPLETQKRLKEKYSYGLNVLTGKSHILTK